MLEGSKIVRVSRWSSILCDRRMNKYTFNFKITPGVDVDYVFPVPPFDATLRDTTLALKVTADAADEQRLAEQADQTARRIARSLSYQLAGGFRVTSQGRHVLRDSGQQSVTVSFNVTVRPADFEAREAAERRERQAAQARIVDLARRETIDATLRDMLEHWSRYAADPDGRLHPLYDVLQVVERLYGGRREAAVALKLKEADLKELGRISNDPTVLNARHPGRAQGPHRVASDAEVKTCERVARALIEHQAAKTVI
jgi:hypothetical protein